MKEVQLKRDLAKADVYRLLSACFYQPEEAFLEENIFTQLKNAMALVCPQKIPETVSLETFFRDTEMETLQLDYSRLFLGPFEIPAKPYGSVYLDGEKIVMGDSTMRALDLYREGGFEVNSDFQEMPDHIAVELEFLYLLSFRQAQALEEDSDERHRLLELKKKFLEEHPGRWIGSLAEAMRQNSGTAFYKGLADLTEQIILENMQELTETI
jgi:TorA maturation chaperone TorD